MCRVTTSSVAEQIGVRLRVPFLAACVLIAAVLTVPWVAYLTPAAESSLLTNVYNPGMGQFRAIDDALYKALLFGLLVYVLWATRFIRERSRATATAVGTLVDDAPATFERAFRSAGRILPPIVAALAMLSVYFVDAIRQGRLVEPDMLPAYLADLVMVACRFVIMFSFVWAYFASVWGLANVCGRPLHMAPYFRDPLLGTRPLGSLSLSLASAFLVGLVLSAVWVAAGAATPALFGLTFGVMTVGVVLFFLPLNAVHVQMAAQKRRESDILAGRYEELFIGQTGGPAGAGRQTGLEDVRAAVGFRVVRDQVGTIRTWPFDTAILARLATSFFLPIVLTIVGRQAVLVVLGL